MRLEILEIMLIFHFNENRNSKKMSKMLFSVSSKSRTSAYEGRKNNETD